MDVNGHEVTTLGHKVTAELGVVAPSELELEWPFLETQLDAEPELWYPWESKEGIKTALEKSTMQLWIVREGEERLFWALTRVQKDGPGSNMTIWWLRGHNALENLPNLWIAFKRMLKDLGVEHVFIKGRPGWIKVLEPLGFRLSRVELTRRID